ncbi:MAG: HAMP domain-containing histidine kinase [Clostridia bacterium]|nr:HAMP domain-containing histidine kinase [Clostridia bacterium]
MRPKKAGAFVKSLMFQFYSFILVFAVVSLIVTASFLVFFNSVQLSESQIREFAPVVFINVFVITAVLLVIDTVRRKLTVDRSVKKIQGTLSRIMNGDFGARIREKDIPTGYTNLADIAESINKLAEELSGVETLRNDFIANVSHELKTPLAVIQNYGTMLQKPGLSEEERLEYAKAVTSTSRRLASLITNILKLNKLENQQIFPVNEEYDLGEQLCECLLNFEDEWEKKGIDIETDVEDGVFIRSDAELLSLVWNNLFSNAIKFTDNGGCVSVAMKRDGKYITVKVSDSGCGMTAEVGQHIFEKFYQGDTSHATKGNGLGLALVKRVVDILQGEIFVESVYGEGSVFTVKIRG